MNLTLWSHCRPDKAQRVRQNHKHAAPIQVLCPGSHALKKPAAGNRPPVFVGLSLTIIYAEFWLLNSELIIAG